MTRHRYLIVGAGPGGLCAGIKLKESGRDDFVILEKASGVGGTWYHNRYPGAACDVPSHLYSFSFDRRLDWPRPFSPQPEILRYFEGVADRHGLRPHLRLDDGVESAVWDDAAQLWRVTTEGGVRYEAPILFSSVGMFNELNYPDIEGLDDFAGTSFHSARWRHDHDLSGERVAVIGSAASAVQFVPEVAKQAGHLDLYQRTANWVIPKEDDPYSAEQLEAFRSDPSLSEALRQKNREELEAIVTYKNKGLLDAAARAGDAAREQVRDPELREKLRPTHPYGCKRPLISNDFYPTFNRDNVTLVTDPIDHIEASGVVTRDGERREADTLILATGFDTTRFLSAIAVTGRDGRSLDEEWRDGAFAYVGTMIPGFPNLFMTYGPNTNNGSILEMIELQVGFAMRQVERIESENIARLEPSVDATTAYNERIQRDIEGVDVWQADCFGYYRVPSGRIVTQWPHNMAAYEATLAEVPAQDLVAAARAS